jgi:hypothetical protein
LEGSSLSKENDVSQVSRPELNEILVNHIVGRFRRFKERYPNEYQKALAITGLQEKEQDP